MRPPTFKTSTSLAFACLTLQLSLSMAGFKVAEDTPEDGADAKKEDKNVCFDFTKPLAAQHWLTKVALYGGATIALGMLATLTKQLEMRNEKVQKWERDEWFEKQNERKKAAKGGGAKPSPPPPGPETAPEVAGDGGHAQTNAPEGGGGDIWIIVKLVVIIALVIILLATVGTLLAKFFNSSTPSSSGKGDKGDKTVESGSNAA